MEETAILLCKREAGRSGNFGFAIFDEKSLVKCYTNSFDQIAGWLRQRAVHRHLPPCFRCVGSNTQRLHALHTNEDRVGEDLRLTCPDHREVRGVETVNWSRSSARWLRLWRPCRRGGNGFAFCLGLALLGHHVGSRMRYRQARVGLRLGLGHRIVLKELLLLLVLVPTFTLPTLVLILMLVPVLASITMSARSRRWWGSLFAGGCAQQPALSEASIAGAPLASPLQIYRDWLPLLFHSSNRGLWPRAC